MIKLLIVDDHKMFRESIGRILTNKKVATILAEAANGYELLKLLDTYSPDLILMDIAMPEMNGIEATKRAIEKQPGLKVLCLSSYGSEKYYFNIIEAGAKGFVLKSTSLAELENAIKIVAKGGSWFSPELIQNIICAISSEPKTNSSINLSKREVEIVKLICRSFTNEQIADKINLSYDTVKWHRANILSKTGCSNSAGLVMYAIKNKIVET